MNRFLTLCIVAWAFGLAVFLLAGCATKAPPRVITRTVEIPVAVKCAVDPGPRPAYADTPEALRGAPDLFEKVKLLLAGREQRMARETELEAASAGCR